MSNEDILKIVVMGREFSINCPQQVREELLLAAEFLENKIQEIKLEGKVIDSDRVIIAAALGIAHELLIFRQSGGFDIEEIRRRITDIRSRVNNELINK